MLSRSAAFIVLAGLSLAGCGGSPVAPLEPITPQELSGPLSLAGVVVATVGGDTIAGASVRLTGAGESTLQTDAGGGFRFESVRAGLLSATVSAPGFLTRHMAFDVARSRSDLRLDIIRDAPPFNLGFYRYFARNAMGPSLATLNPWQRAPSFYLRTRTSDTNQPVDPVLVDGIRRIITASVPELSAGKWSVDEFETGEEDRVPIEGWVRIRFLGNPTLGEDIWGMSSIGPTSANSISVLYNATTLLHASSNARGACASAVLRIMEHEIVHTMGFTHTEDVAKDFLTPDCSGVGRSAEARYHAQIVYARPRGSRDIDRDNSTTSLTSSQSTSDPSTRSVSCTRLMIARRE